MHTNTTIFAKLKTYTLLVLVCIMLMSSLSGHIYSFHKPSTNGLSFQNTQPNTDNHNDILTQRNLGKTQQNPQNSSPSQPATNLKIYDSLLTTPNKPSQVPIETKDDIDPTLVDIIFEPSEIAPPSQLTTANNSSVASIFQTLAVPTGLIGFATSSLQPMQKGVPIPANFSVTFSQTPSPELISSLQFYPTAQFTTQLTGNTLTVTTNNLNRNQEYIFGLRSTMICSTSVCSPDKEIWYYSIPFQTAHWQKITYGSSVLGRPLEAWVFGNSDGNGKRIMLTGATHGEEWHAGALWQLRDILIANPQEIIGRNKTIVIVPFVNIDGVIVQQTTGSYGLDARYNARGVNLNRSFPAGWIPCSICGPYPGSEPETANLITLVRQQSITHMIAYHNQWPPRGIIFMGNTRNPATQNMAYWVSQRTGYPVGVYNGPEVATTSSVPGDQVVWAETLGITAILIEGTYRGVTDWEKNYPMYLALIRDF